MRAPDGAVVECFEWSGREAIETAHSHPEVQSMWKRFGECCDYGTLDDLPNSSVVFAEFERIGIH